MMDGKTLKTTLIAGAVAAALGAGMIAQSALAQNAPLSPADRAAHAYEEMIAHGKGRQLTAQQRATGLAYARQHRYSADQTQANRAAHADEEMIAHGKGRQLTPYQRQTGLAYAGSQRQDTAADAQTLRAARADAEMIKHGKGNQLTRKQRADGEMILHHKSLPQ